MKFKLIVILLSSTILISSCKVFDPSRMMRMKPGYPYARLPDYPVYTDEYRLAPYDKLNFILYSNNGENLVRVMGEQYSQGGTPTTTFTVEHDGTVRLPLIDRVYVQGMTLREAEKLIESKYAKYYQQPFALLSVTNTRVLVFKGGNQATVINLQRPNTTLLEIIAQTGGTDNVKTHRIKLVRGDLNNPEVYLIDLSKIEGLRQGNIIVQANDIIYLQPRDRVTQKILENVTPYLTLFSTIMIIYNIIK